MAKNTSVILGDHFDKFIQSEIESGRYKSASEVIRSGLRILEDEKIKINQINNALVVGESSGKLKEFDPIQFKKKMKKKLGLNA